MKEPALEFTCPACRVPMSQLPEGHVPSISVEGITYCPDRPLGVLMVTADQHVDVSEALDAGAMIECWGAGGSGGSGP